MVIGDLHKGCFSGAEGKDSALSRFERMGREKLETVSETTLSRISGVKKSRVWHLDLRVSDPHWVGVESPEEFSK